MELLLLFFQVPLTENCATEYRYRVKVIPSVKKDYRIISWHGVNEKFKSLPELKRKLLSTLDDYLPPPSVDSFEVGYLEGRKQTKRWMISEQDILEMYENEGDEIILWCDGKNVTGKRKNSDDVNPEEPASKHCRGSHENQIEDMAKELGSIHSDKFSYSQYKVWARMIINKQHTDKDIPPNIPVIMGKIEKKSKKDFSDTVADCAVAIVKALAPASASNQATCSYATANAVQVLPDGISPSKKVNLRSQYFSQLRTLQNLRDDGVLTQEFQHEKLAILDNLKAIG